MKHKMLTPNRGLSPLARGIHRLMRHNDMYARFIPAGAGNTMQRKQRRWWGTVYPRWRGEHVDAVKAFIPGFGLSPLARRTRSAFYRPGRSLRFIPAGAGNTSITSSVAGFSPVYPRWRGAHSPGQKMFSCGRGEHIRVLNNVVTKLGLSPLARGTRARTTGGSPSGRFIPAGAGNTFRGNARRSAGAVYPRWRGEHRMRPARYCKMYGLSPLARGTHKSTLSIFRLKRFIPAGAGNTVKASML